MQQWNNVMKYWKMVSKLSCLAMTVISKTHALYTWIKVKLNLKSNKKSKLS